MIKFKKNIIRLEGEVLECLPGNKYRVKVNDKIVLAYLCGNMIRNHIKLIQEDIVLIEFSIFDFNRGRIILRK